MYLSQFHPEAIKEAGNGFRATFGSVIPPIDRMSTLVGYANRAQQSAGRTRFEISEAPYPDLTFRPKGDTADTPPSTLYEHLLHFLVEVGFLPEDHRPNPDIPEAGTASFNPFARAAA